MSKTGKKVAIIATDDLRKTLQAAPKQDETESMLQLAGRVTTAAADSLLSIAGLLVDEIPIVKTIASVLHSIVDVSARIQSNKEQCDLLVSRIFRVVSALQPLVGPAASKRRAANFDAVLERFVGTLRACYETIDGFSSEMRVKRWLKASSHQTKFEELANQLNQDQQDLALGLDVDAFASREADRVARERDVQMLEATLLQIADGQKAGLKLLSGKLRQQKAQTEQLERALTEEFAAQFAAFKAELTSASKGPVAAAPQNRLPEIHDHELELIDDAVELQAASADGNAVTYAALWLGERVSVKRLMPGANETLSKSDQERFLREAEILASLRHPRVLAVFGASVNQYGALLVSELIERGSLDVHAYGGALATVKRAQLAADVATALEYIHSRGVWHRSLRAAACVVTADWRCKLADMARAKSTASAIATAAEASDDWRWSAPEVLLSTAKSASAAADMFSFGMLLFELFVGCAPHADCAGTDDAKFRTILTSYSAASKTVLELPTVPVDNVALPTMQQCWQRNPLLRLTAREAGDDMRELSKSGDLIKALLEEAKAAFAAQKADEAVSLLLGAAKLQSPHAHAKLGDVFAGALKSTVAVDGARAVAHYEKAAELGLDRGAFNAACLHRAGELVPRNRTRALQMFERARELGNVAAATEIAALK